MNTIKTSKKRSLSIFIIIALAVAVFLLLGYWSTTRERHYLDFSKRQVQTLLSDPTAAMFWGLELVEKPDKLLAVCGKVNINSRNETPQFVRFVSYDTGEPSKNEDSSIWTTQIDGYFETQEMDRLYKKHCKDVSNQNIVIYSE